MASWNDLPFEVIVEIYCYLPSQDRYNLSRTCKQWLAALLNPKIWRGAHFHVNFHNKESKLRTPDKVLLALRSLTLDFSEPEKPDATFNLKMGGILTSLERVGNNSLESLSIIALYVNMDILNHLLTFQQKLKHLSLHRLGACYSCVAELVRRVSVNFADKLERLEVRDEKFDVCSTAMLKLPEEVSTLTPNLPAGISFLTRLSELSVSYEFLSDSVLSGLPGTLQMIRIWISTEEGYVSDINKDLFQSWHALTTRLPTLRAEYHISELDNVMYLVKIIPEAVPLSCLYWQSKRYSSKRNMTRCFKYIMENFENLLELHINVCMNLFIEKEVAATLERFPVLKTFSVCQKSRTKRFSVNHLGQALEHMLACNPNRRLANTNITITHRLKDSVNVITVKDWNASVEDVAH